MSIVFFSALKNVLCGNVTVQKSYRMYIAVPLSPNRVVLFRDGHIHIRCSNKQGHEKAPFGELRRDREKGNGCSA